VFTIGGAQAVGALAYGTATLPQVDKIVGPGNAYVAAAKRRVFGTVGIDMIAGPSEILVICDGTTDPDWVAMDLFSQAEHDELAQSILLCPDADYLPRGRKHPAPAADDAAPRGHRGLAVRPWRADQGARHGRSLRDRQRIAPEHLEISAENPRQWSEKIRHAGAIFLGRYTSESLGDYCAGPTTCCRPRAPRVSRRRWACTTSRSVRA
jgi:histidinol dehydrogenase